MSRRTAPVRIVLFGRGKVPEYLTNPRCAQTGNLRAEGHLSLQILRLQGR